MIRTNVAELQALFYNRLKTDSQGGVLRSALGDGANSVLHARELLMEDQKTPSVLPTRPLLAMRAGSLNESDRTLYLASVDWYIYDDPVQGYWRINSLISMIGQAYDVAGMLSISGRLFGDMEMPFVSDELPDPTLGLLFRYLRVAVPFLSGKS